MSMLKHLKGSRLRKGAVVRLRVTRPGTIGRVNTWTIRAPKAPKLVRRCVVPGKKKPAALPGGVAPGAQHGYGHPPWPLVRTPVELPSPLLRS